MAIHDDERSASFASPPCFMHELGASYAGLATDWQQQTDVSRWRRAERQRLIAARLAIGAVARRAYAAAIAESLDAIVGEVAGKTIGVYWPIRGEPDLRAWMERVRARGGVCAIPVVVERRASLVYRAWRRGEALERGPWNIPAPAKGAAVVPDFVIAPVVGFDRCCYRLGNGTGLFDRTLAAFATRPRAIGVGYATLEVPTIYPQPHDIPMDLIVTEKEVVVPSPAAPGARDD